MRRVRKRATVSLPSGPNKRTFKSILIIPIILIAVWIVLRFWQKKSPQRDPLPQYKPNPSILFIVPLSPKHFYYAYDNIVPQFAQNTSTIECHVLFVFSTVQEMNSFEKVKFTSNDTRLYISNYTNIFAVTYNEKTDSIVTMKKWYGLYQVRYTRRYDYYITVDSEVMFLKPIDSEFFVRLENTDSISGDSVEPFPFPGFIETERDFMLRYMVNLQDKVRALFSKPIPYVWFSDVPFYRENTLDAFFADIQYQPTAEYASTVGWYVYDHMIYIYWLVMTRHFKIVNNGEWGHPEWSLESCYDPKIMDQVLLHYKPLWLNNRVHTAYRQRNPNDPALSNFYLVYHLDRIG